MLHLVKNVLCYIPTYLHMYVVLHTNYVYKVIVTYAFSYIVRNLVSWFVIPVGWCTPEIVLSTAYTVAIEWPSEPLRE